MTIPKKTKPNRSLQPILENPDALPEWSPPSPEEVMASMERDMESADVERLLAFRPGPDEEHLAAKQAQTIFLVAQRLRVVNRRIMLWIGRIAVMVEDFYLWRHVPGCESPNDFWRLSEWPLTTVRTAIALQRSAVPLASALSLDLAEYEEDLSSVKAQALTRLAKAHLPYVADYDDNQKTALREEMLEVVGMPNGELIKSGKTKAVAKKSTTAVIVEEPPRERIGYRVRLSIVTGVDGPKVHGEFDLSPEQLAAAIDNRAFPVYTYSGIEYDLAHMQVELEAFNKAKKVTPTPKPVDKPVPQNATAVEKNATPAPTVAPPATSVAKSTTPVVGSGVGEKKGGAVGKPKTTKGTAGGESAKAGAAVAGRAARPKVEDFDDFQIDDLGWDTDIQPTYR